MSRTSLSRRQKWRMTIQNWIIAANHDIEDAFTVLDLGTEYGHSARAIKDHFPNCQIHGIEIHGPTLDACKSDAGHLYENLQLGDVRKFVASGGHHGYSVVLAAEIVEHMSEDDGESFLSGLHGGGNHNGVVIVTSPLGFMAQKALDGNPYQNHVSGWTREQIEYLGFRTFVEMPTCSLGVYISGKVNL